MVKQAKMGDNVRVHYTGRLEDGTVFGSTKDRDPLELTLGTGKFVKGFEDAVTGMVEGENKTVKVPAEEAFGVHRTELMIRVDKAKFPSNIEPKEGMALRVERPSGDIMEATIAEVSEDVVTLDFNHPLAGKELTFEIGLINIG